MHAFRRRILVMTLRSTFLAPGQRYAPPGIPTWKLKPQVIVLSVYQGSDGDFRIAYRRPSGEVRLTFAARLEAEVEAGKLVPVAGAGGPVNC
jgi:hypothetical protein